MLCTHKELIWFHKPVILGICMEIKPKMITNENINFNMHFAVLYTSHANGSMPIPTTNSHEKLIVVVSHTDKCILYFL